MTARRSRPAPSGWTPGRIQHHRGRETENTKAAAARTGPPPQPCTARLLAEIPIWVWMATMSQPLHYRRKPAVCEVHRRGRAACIEHRFTGRRRPRPRGGRFQHRRSFGQPERQGKLATPRRRFCDAYVGPARHCPASALDALTASSWSAMSARYEVRGQRQFSAAPDVGVTLRSGFLDGVSRHRHLARGAATVAGAFRHRRRQRRGGGSR